MILIILGIFLSIAIITVAVLAATGVFKKHSGNGPGPSPGPSPGPTPKPGPTPGPSPTQYSCKKSNGSFSCVPTTNGDYPHRSDCNQACVNLVPYKPLASVNLNLIDVEDYKSLDHPRDCINALGLSGKNLATNSDLIFYLLTGLDPTKQKTTKLEFTQLSDLPCYFNANLGSSSPPFLKVDKKILSGLTKCEDINSTDPDNSVNCINVGKKYRDKENKSDISVLHACGLHYDVASNDSTGSDWLISSTSNDTSGFVRTLHYRNTSPIIQYNSSEYIPYYIANWIITVRNKDNKIVLLLLSHDVHGPLYPKMPKNWYILYMGLPPCVKLNKVGAPFHYLDDIRIYGSLSFS